MLSNELRRGIKNPYTWIGLFIAFILYGVSFTESEWRNIIQYGHSTVVDVHNAFIIEFNPFRSLIPLSASFPMCMSVAEDWEHGFSGRIITRSSFQHYSYSRFFASGILSGGVLAITLTIFLSFDSFFIPLWSEESYFEPFVLPLLQRGSIILYLAYFSSLQFLFGFAISSIGNVIAVLTNTRSVILLGTTLMFAILETATNVTLVGLSGAQSAIVFRYSYQTPFAVWMLIAGIFLCVTTVAFFAYQKLFRRRQYVWI